MHHGVPVQDDLSPDVTQVNDLPRHLNHWLHIQLNQRHCVSLLLLSEGQELLILLLLKDGREVAIDLISEELV